MKHRTHLALLATLIAAPAMAQDFNVSSTTMAQLWRQDNPGFAKTTNMPLTEFLAIDINKLGNEKVSMHLYGWGTVDLQDQSMPGKKNPGDFTYGYLQYDFDRANAQVKAGRFAVNQGGSNEIVDGVYARTDLKGGFNVSAFGGQPVIYRNLGNMPQDQISMQQDIIVGARLGWRMNRFGEIGLSYLQDGTKAAKDLDVPQTIDYTRKQMGADIKLAPVSFLDITGRTVFDLAKHPDAAPGVDRSKIAQHDYVARVKATDTLAFTGSFVERNYYAYYAGSTLPSLFNQNEKGKFTATGGSAIWSPLSFLQVTADLKETKRELYGNATRAGAACRFSFPTQHVVTGVGYHKVNAFSVNQVDPANPSFSLSHGELRAWVMVENGPASFSLDGIVLKYTDKDFNPNTLGRNEGMLVASAGYQVAPSFRLSGDVSYAETALYAKQIAGLLRAEYRFGFAGKGGK